MKEVSSVLIIYNPFALKGKIDEVLPKIKQRLSLRYSQVDSMAGQTEDGAEQLALKFASKYDIIVACGGDGTVHQVLNGVVKSGSNPIVGLLPCGTCNDLARTLKIPFDLMKAADCILRLNTRKHDLMFDGKDYIAYTLATGYLTQTSYIASSKAKKRFGRMAYVFLGIGCAMHFDEFPMTMIMCKNKSDCIRLYNFFLKKKEENKNKQVIFIGSCDKLSDNSREIENEISILTGWNKIKIQRSTN